MSLESYLKALVGNTPDVQIVFDNSSSKLPEQLSPRAHSEVASSNHPEKSESRMQDASICALCLTPPDSPLTPLSHRSIIEDFRERQKAILMSMSPGVWPDRSPRTGQRSRSLPTSPNATNSHLAKKRSRVRNFKQKLPDVDLRF
jgi:hypothetical protein